MTYQNHLLDARPDRLDLRDREYRPHLQSLPPVYPSPDQVALYLDCYKKNKLILDQGKEGACTGFGLAATINYLIFRDAFAEQGDDSPQCDLGIKDKRVSERMLYHLARIYDEWPGEDYQGSSCRGAMKGWHRHGVCRKSTWPYKKSGAFQPPAEGWEVEALETTLGAYYRIDNQSINDMQAAIYEVGAIYCSAQVHKGWDVTKRKSLPLIKMPRNDDLWGGHAFCIVGYNQDGFIVQNSWGEDWGNTGFAVLSYADWVQHGRDAWVVARGVPIALDSVPIMLADDSLKDYAFSNQKMARPNAKSIKRRIKLRSYEYPENSLTKPWSREQAMHHSLLIENNGRPKHTVISEADADSSASYVSETQLRTWLDKKKSNRKVVVYAHGGLVGEGAALKKVQVMGPCFYANDIYPIYAVWKTGLLETAGNLLSQAMKSLFGGDRDQGFIESIADKTDSTLEAAVRNLGIGSFWSEMKQNALAASDRAIAGTQQNRAGKKGAMVLLAESLQRVLQDYPDLQIHIVGHSAGSILLGAWLKELQKRNMSVKTASLLAPACTIEFANQHFKTASDNGVLDKKQLWIHNMDDEREQADTTSPLYRKSLLYLVSRAFEPTHKMPILGLQAAWSLDNYREKKSGGFNFDQRQQTKNWLDFIDGAKKPAIYDKDDRKVLVSLKPEFADLTHSSFDNDIAVLEKTIKLIRGGRLKVAVENLGG